MKRLLKALELASKSIEQSGLDKIHVIIVPGEGRPQYQCLDSREAVVAVLHQLYGQPDTFCYVIEGGSRWKLTTTPDFMALPPGEAPILIRKLQGDPSDDAALFVQVSAPPSDEYVNSDGCADEASTVDLPMAADGVFPAAEYPVSMEDDFESEE